MKSVNDMVLLARKEELAVLEWLHKPEVQAFLDKAPDSASFSLHLERCKTHVTVSASVCANGDMLFSGALTTYDRTAHV